MNDTTNPMPHDRALQIVDAINARSFLCMGLRDDLDGLVPLVDVPLADMIAAAATVEDENDRREAVDGRRMLHVVPSERLIAAVYVLENYRPSGQAIAASMVDGRDQLLAVLYANSGEGAGQ